MSEETLQCFRIVISFTCEFCSFHEMINYVGIPSLLGGTLIECLKLYGIRVEKRDYTRPYARTGAGFLVG